MRIHNFPVKELYAIWMSAHKRDHSWDSGMYASVIHTIITRHFFLTLRSFNEIPSANVSKLWSPTIQATMRLCDVSQVCYTQRLQSLWAADRPTWRCVRRRVPCLTSLATRYMMYRHGYVTSTLTCASEPAVAQLSDGGGGGGEVGSSP